MTTTDDDTDNDARANRVAAFVHAYLNEHYYNPADRELFHEGTPEGAEQVEMVVGDMMSDLAHYVDLRGGNGVVSLNSGQSHHEAETNWIVTFPDGTTKSVAAHDEAGVLLALPDGPLPERIEWGGY